MLAMFPLGRRVTRGACPTHMWCGPWVLIVDEPRDHVSEMLVCLRAQSEHLRRV